MYARETTMFSGELKEGSLEQDHSEFIEKSRNHPVITGDKKKYDINNLHMDDEME